MRISTKGRYATRIMTFLAARNSEEPATRQEISAAEGVTPHYVEQILVRLRNADLVKSHRGTSGGFSLARSPKAITVEDILHATEGSMELAPCENTECQRRPTCSAGRLWREAAEAMHALFRKKTLADLVSESQTLRSQSSVSFDI